MTVFLPLLLSLWGHVGGACSVVEETRITQACESGGVYRRVNVETGVFVSVDVQATPAADGRFWATIALNADIPADNRYTSAGIEQGIAPFWGDEGAWAVQLSTPASECCTRLKPIDPADWHHIEVGYTAGHATLAVDGVQKTVAIDLGDSASLELLCVATDPGESKPGNVAQCSWRNLEVVYAP